MTQSIPDKVKDLVTGSIALRRFGEPIEIADAVAFLGNYIFILKHFFSVS